MANQQYDNNMRGVLFLNERKESDRHPDYKGSAEVDGVEYWISAWVKVPQSGGNKFLSISFTPKDDSQTQGRSGSTSRPQSAQSFLDDNRDKIDKHKRPQAPSAPRQPAPDYDSFDEDIPF